MGLLSLDRARRRGLGLSADGALRYEHDLGPYVDGRYDAAPIGPALRRTVGRLLFDGGGLAVEPYRAPGATPACCSASTRARSQTLLRIDPGAAFLRDLATGGAERP